VPAKRGSRERKKKKKKKKKPKTEKDLSLQRKKRPIPSGGTDDGPWEGVSSKGRANLRGTWFRLQKATLMKKAFVNVAEFSGIIKRRGRSHEPRGIEQGRGFKKALNQKNRFCPLGIQFPGLPSD